jgi:flagellar motility protein MotE (MotC chaperone)
MTAFKSKSRFLRLFPGVILVCGGLMVLKVSGIVHDALAGEPAPSSGALQAPPQPANQDFAGGDSQTASAAEVDVLTSLSKRRAAMDAREAEIQSEANVLAATEARVDTKIAQLKQLQGQIAALLAQRDAAQEKQVAALMKVYSAMKPKDAANIFNSLDDSVLLPVAQEMKSDTLAPVLAAMNPESARKLTMKLASKLALPDTNAALEPVTAASGAVQAPAGQPAGQAAPATQPQAAQPKAAQPKAASSTGAAPPAKPKS